MQKQCLVLELTVLRWGDWREMKRLGQYVLGFFFLVLVVQVVILAPKTVEEPESHEVLAPTEVTQKIDQVMHGAHLVETRESQKEWELWADEALSFKALDRWNLKKVKAVFFGKNGVFFTVTGETGVVETKTKNMRVEGNVLTRSSNGYTFRTEVVEYDSEKRLLLSPGAVQMVGPPDKQGGGLKLRGQKMDLSIETSLMNVSGKVEAEKDFPKERRLFIHSDNAQFSSHSNLARFYNNVVMDMDTMRITGPEAQFNYDAKEEQVSSVLVRGGVRVTDVDKWATSERLLVNFSKETYVFQGKPRVIQNNDELVGEKITFFEGGKRVSVEGARARMDQKRLDGKVERFN